MSIKTHHHPQYAAVTARELADTYIGYKGPKEMLIQELSFRLQDVLDDNELMEDLKQQLVEKDREIEKLEDRLDNAKATLQELQK